MTTGSYDDDRRTNGSEVVTIWPSGLIVQTNGTHPGLRVTKSWSGTDYPPNAKPVYEKYTWIRRSDGRKFTAKIRTDTPTRRKTVDHPYSMAYQFGTYDADNSSSKYEYGQLSETRVGSWAYSAFNVGFYNVTGEWDANDDIALIGKLREQIAGSDFNMGVFLGEGREALHTIADAATRIRLSLNALRRGNILGAANALGRDTHRRIKLRADMQSNWLQLQYGWLPLLQDVKGGAEFLAKLLNYPMVQTYKVKRKRPLSAGRWPSGSQTTREWSFFGETQGQLIARLSEVNVPQLSGLLDPASVAWELTPWSFVIDWFIPIGNYLADRSLANALSGTFVTTKTRRLNCQYGGGCWPIKNGPVATAYSGPWSGYTTQVNVNRVVSSSLSVPLPTFKRLDQVVSWKHAANAIALLGQLKR